MLLMAAPAHADLTHKISSSVQLSVDAAATNVQRIGNSYSVSGAAAGSLPTAYQTVDGNAFSYSNSFTAGDSIVTTAPTVGAVSAYSNQTSTAAGTGTPAGTISSAGVVTLTAAGSGTSATGQFVTEITIK
jgi:hypothetical protein